MGEVADFPAPKWWHLPEQMGLVAVPGFMVLVYCLTFVQSPFFAFSSLLPVAGLLGIGSVLGGSYSLTLRTRVYSAAYMGLYFGLFMSTYMFAPDHTSLWFVVLFISSGAMFGAGMYLFSNPEKVSYDWTQIYVDAPYPADSFAAKRVKYWPFVTLTAIFATLILTRSPAWAILTGAAFLAFTPPAFLRNPATARPVLAQLLNILTVCLILLAAASMTLKGH